MKNRRIKHMGKIAVVGMAGVFPHAKDTTQFLENIIHKRNAVSTVANHRWIGPVKDFISAGPLPDKAISSKAGLIDNFEFDATDFLVDKDLLSELDPLHQLVLHAGRDALLQCSHTKKDKQRTGVILASIALPTDASSLYSWNMLCTSNKAYTGPVPKDFSTTAVVSFPGAILSRAMGLEGGSFTLDAACASSLYAIKLACEHLCLKKADTMVAGGVSRPDSLYTQIGFTQLQALSPSGKCSPFDRTADGLVVGEGTGIVVLKRLEDAIDCGDKIHAVITGAGVSNDIEGTLVGPASEGQVRAMVQAYRQASWSPVDIQYMECHGSGTPVGDQVELSSIQALLDAFDCPDKGLAIGSVKSMIGHLLTAAGAAGFIKTVLSMNKKILPPSLNFSAPSSKSLLNTSNIKVQTTVEDWIPQTLHSTRKAGISAFGFGGINAHLL
ncbi:MAG: polyketide synthase, partial [Proteobacteria bacterium]|nr:polyketide synthase [Pseudomonadota bacterium]